VTFNILWHFKGGSVDSSVWRLVALEL